VTHVVAISGGKDSCAMGLWLAKNEPREYAFVCTPTGDELPAMHDHWKRMEDLLGAPIHHLPRLTLKELIKKKRMLPNWRARFCTHQLKIVPFENWILEHLPATAYVGLRADEDARSGADYGIDLLVKTRWPLREIGWGINEVWAFLRSLGVTIPRRTDCARCPLQSLWEWYELWVYHPDIYEDACCDEDDLGHTYRSPGRDSWPASLRALAALFASGKVPKQRQRDGDFCRVCSM